MTKRGVDALVCILVLGAIVAALTGHGDIVAPCVWAAVAVFVLA